LAYSSSTGNWINQGLQYSQFPAGSIVQVVSTTKTDVYSTVIGTDAITPNIPGMSATITPRFSNSLIYVMINLNASVTVSGTLTFVTYRNDSPVFIGDAASLRRRASAGGLGAVASAFSLLTTSWNFLDSPASTAAQTYTIRGGHATASDQTFFVNRSSGDNDLLRVGRGASAITLMEVRQ
jgi:hypothetical protein